MYTTSYISFAAEPIPIVAFAVLKSPKIYFLRLWFFADAFTNSSIFFASIPAYTTYLD